MQRTICFFAISNILRMLTGMKDTESLAIIYIQDKEVQYRLSLVMNDELFREGTSFLFRALPFAV